MTRKELNQLRISELDKLIKEYRLPRRQEGRVQKIERLLAWVKVQDRIAQRAHVQALATVDGRPVQVDAVATVSIPAKKRGRPKKNERSISD